MNNDQFRALVQEQSKPKTTKEIAREAVQNEFEKRKQRKRSRGGGESSSSEDEKDDLFKGKSKKQRTLKLGKSERSTGRQYRDRAKERREGQNNDYNNSVALLDSVNAADEEDALALSKYLGGDEAHTHLVKGLDVALAQHMKRQIESSQQQNQGDDLDQVLQTSQLVKKAQSPTETKEIKSSTDAMNYLKTTGPDNRTSDLGRDVLKYFQRRHVTPNVCDDLSTTAAGFALQRTNLTFLGHGDPLDRIHSWDAPHETTHASVVGGEAGLNRGNSAIKVTNLLKPVEFSIGKTPKRVSSFLNERRISDIKATEYLSGQCPKGEDESDDDIFEDVGDYAPMDDATDDE